MSLCILLVGGCPRQISCFSKDREVTDDLYPKWSGKGRQRVKCNGMQWHMYTSMYMYVYIARRCTRRLTIFTHSGAINNSLSFFLIKCCNQGGEGLTSDTAWRVCWCVLCYKSTVARPCFCSGGQWGVVRGRGQGRQDGGVASSSRRRRGEGLVHL